MRNSNIYVVKQTEVECMPGFCTKSGKDEYSSAVGFGMGTSIKQALADCKKMLSATQNGGTPILGNMIVTKGGVDITAKLFPVYNPYDKWTASDQNMFETFLQRHRDEVELERLIAEEERLAA